MSGVLSPPLSGVSTLVRARTLAASAMMEVPVAGVRGVLSGAPAAAAGEQNSQMVQSWEIRNRKILQKLKRIRVRNYLTEEQCTEDRLRCVPTELHCVYFKIFVDSKAKSSISLLQLGHNTR